MKTDSSTNIKASNTLFILVSFLAPFVGIAVGYFFAMKSGVSYFAFLPNFVGVILGIPLALLLRKYFANPKVVLIISALVLLLSFATLFFTGTEGVHRWIPMGPLQINVSMAFLPIVLGGAIYFIGKKPALSFALLLSMMLVHCLQPDAGQALAFAISSSVLCAMATALSKWLRLLGIVVFAIGAFVTLTRIDPLAPVAHVERILHLISAAGPIGVVAMFCGVIVLFVPLVWILCFAPAHKEARILILTFGAYLLAQFLVTEYGNYPVPVLGAGASPVIGWYVMLGITLSVFAL